MPFLAFGVAFAALVARLLMKARADRRARGEKLVRMGFAPCSSEAEIEMLVEQITCFENNSGYRYRVEEVMRISLRGDAAWFYRKERSRSGNIVAVHEFHFPLDRPSREGVVLFFKPSALRSGTSATFVGSLATGGWDSQPDDLTRLPVPEDLRHGNLIGILAPAGASLFELIEPKAIAALQPVGDHGATRVACRDGWCSFSSSSTRHDFDLEGLWSIIQGLASLS